MTAPLGRDFNSKVLKRKQLGILQLCSLNLLTESTCNANFQKTLHFVTIWRNIQNLLNCSISDADYVLPVVVGSINDPPPAVGEELCAEANGQKAIGIDQI